MERSGRVEICKLTINLHTLYKDLLSAMDKYVEDICRNQKVSDVLNDALEARRKEEVETEKLLNNKAYICQSDIDFVKGQVSNL